MVEARSLQGARQPVHTPGRAARTVHRLTVHVVYLVSFLVGDDWIGRRIRVAVLRMSGASIAPGASIHGGGYISDPRNLVLGRGSFINRNCYLDLSAP